VMRRRPVMMVRIGWPFGVITKVAEAARAWGGNGRSRWREALGQVRRGKGPRVEKLLREMQWDYGTNAGLRFLSEDREFGGNR
jgi:hypothetical protein